VPFEILTILFVVAVCAGIVDAIAGGGGLITLPALFLAGLSPAEALATNKIQALATNKIQALASVASSAHRYARSQEVDRQAIWMKVLASVVGAGLGAYSVQKIDPSLLAQVAPRR
jgi:uncharacterized membrane protein YfcA